MLIHSPYLLTDAVITHSIALICTPTTVFYSIILLNDLIKRPLFMYAQDFTTKIPDSKLG
jgi:hypothetical protein